jgi:hypothetical protein
VTGASWPKSVPLCALRRRGPIPGCVASMILPSLKVDPSCCGFACSAGRDIQAVDDTARVVDPPRPWPSSSTTTPPACEPTLPACTQRRTASSCCATPDRRTDEHNGASRLTVAELDRLCRVGLLFGRGPA